jgi:hypothetical protein
MTPAALWGIDPIMDSDRFVGGRLGKRSFISTPDLNKTENKNCAHGPSWLWARRRMESNRRFRGRAHYRDVNNSNRSAENWVVGQVEISSVAGELARRIC